MSILLFASGAVPIGLPLLVALDSLAHLWGLYIMAGGRKSRWLASGWSESAAVDSAGADWLGIIRLPGGPLKHKRSIYVLERASRSFGRSVGGD